MLAAFDERVRAIVEEALPRQPAADEQGVTAAEAARVLGVAKWRVYEIVRRGALPSYRPSPKTLRIPLGAVKNYIARAAAGDRFPTPRTTRKEVGNR